jgi:hypothetical protein
MPVHVCAPNPGSTRTTTIVLISTNARVTPEENLRDTCTSVLPDMHSGKFHDGVRKSPSFHHVPVGCANQYQERPRQKGETLVPGI